TADWLSSPRTQNMWSSMVNWVLPPPPSDSLSLSASVASGFVNIGVDTSAGPSNQALSARVVGPHAATTVDLQPTAPNHYTGQIQAGSQGAYLIDVQARLTGTGRKAGLTQSVSGGVVVPYAPDYRDTGTDFTALRNIAAAGGGTIIKDPSAAFANNLAPVNAPTPLQTPLLLLALLLLPLDVAARRLVLQRSDWVTQLHALAMRRSDSRGPVENSTTAMLRKRRTSVPFRAQSHNLVPRKAVQTTRTVPTAETPPPGIRRDSRTSQPTATNAAQVPATTDDVGTRNPEGRATSPAPVNGEHGSSAASNLLESKRRRRKR
ncbi:MAG: hypothetical protein JWO42_2099, partial [Chloroflexi bacterium]|nr:hypothetical protein [Chloroflexota bacterium]